MDQLDEEFLWLDADLLLSPGWSEIFNQKGDRPTDDCVFYAVKDIEQTLSRLRTLENSAFKRAGNRYFNAGVLRVNPMNWRALPASKNWFEIASDLNSYNMQYSDQDILNFLGSDKTSLLPSGFNWIVGSPIDPRDNVLCRHYAGSPKPWSMTSQKKELLLAIQGANYFRQADSIMTIRDGFVEYPYYWNMENDLLAILRKKDKDFYCKVEQNRKKYSQPIGLLSKIKIESIKFLSKKFLK
jgi:lipopolysaccharide biosynthesis glycosyltransferase